MSLSATFCIFAELQEPSCAFLLGRVDRFGQLRSTVDALVINMSFEVLTFADRVMLHNKNLYYPSEKSLRRSSYRAIKSIGMIDMHVGMHG